MAEAITSNAYRRRVAKHMADNSALPPIAYVAFGDGGHNADLTPKAPNADATGLARAAASLGDAFRPHPPARIPGARTGGGARRRRDHRRRAVPGGAAPSAGAHRC